MKRNVGRRVFLGIDRPNPALVEKFRGIPSSNLGDMMQRLYCTNGSIRPLNNVPLLGVAFTVKCPAGDNMMFHRAMDLAQPGDVIVVDGQGSMERSLAGEIMMLYCKSRKIAGVVVEGCMRDSDSIAKMDFPVYCKGITPQGPYKFGPGEINVPVCVGGQVINPGDILVGDGDGIAVIRPEDAEDVLQAVLDKVSLEETTIRNYSSGNVNYEKHQKLYGGQMENEGYSYFEKGAQD